MNALRRLDRWLGARHETVAIYATLIAGLAIMWGVVLAMALLGGCCWGEAAIWEPCPRAPMWAIP